MMFFLAMAFVYFLGAALLMGVAALGMALERAYEDSQRKNAIERYNTDLAEASRQKAMERKYSHSAQMREITRLSREIESQVWLQNQRQYWNDWNRHNDFR